MGWSIGFDDNWKRDIGYGVPAVCDHPGCKEEIDRGLSYVCGGEPYGGDDGCGLFFCEKHTYYKEGSGRSVCCRCRDDQMPFDAKPDTREWLDWKETHPSWAEWRKERDRKQAEELEPGRHPRIDGAD